MAISAVIPAAAETRPSFALPLGVKRFVNALVSSRVRAAQAELRRHDIMIHETSLIHGPYRRISLNEAELLPFNA